VSITGFRRFAFAVLGVTLGVIVWGAYVRASGSGAGCGSHWPTCDGEMIPRPKSIEMIVELFHRATSALVTVLVAVEVFLAFRIFPKGHRVRRAVLAAMAFLVGEALIGARLVLGDLVTTNASLARAGWMSLHLVNTFLLLGSLALAAWFAAAGAAPRLRFRAGATSLLVMGLAGAAVVGMTGALAALGDTLFPSRSLADGLSGDLSPAAHLLVRIRVLHPIAAVLVGGYLVVVAAVVAERVGTPEVRSLSNRLSRLVFSQFALGAINLWLLAPIWAQLLHLLLADLVLILLVLLTAASLEIAPSPEMGGEAAASTA
jgi:heme A synthase